MQSVGFAMPLKLGLTDWAAPKSTGKSDPLYSKQCILLP